MEVTRRQFLKGTAATGVGLALARLGFDPRPVRAAAAGLRTVGAREVWSTCTYCSVGCGLIAYVRDGKLVHIEGDPEHPNNDGGLCSKGSSLSVIPNSPRRLTRPLRRAPGSDRWEPISWEEAFDRIARKIQDVRDRYWIAQETLDGQVYTVHRNEAMGFFGTALVTNEEAYLWVKMARILGAVYIDHQARL